jgi:hypothetical protein
MNYQSSVTEEENPFFDQRLNNALDGLEEYFYDHLKNRISKLNAQTIVNYILAMKVETNLSTNHKRGVVTSLKLLSQFLGDKSFKEMTKEDLLAFLDLDLEYYQYIYTHHTIPVNLPLILEIFWKSLVVH